MSDNDGSCGGRRGVGHGLRRRQGRSLRLVVERDGQIDPAPVRRSDPGLVDLELQRVEDDVGHRLDDIDLGRRPALEGGGFQVRFERQLVAGGDNRARESVGIRFAHPTQGISITPR